MTFDEALNELEPRSIWSSEMRDLLEQLRQEYAPIVEMTEGQAKTILDQEQGKYLTSLLADNGKYFDYLFWEPLTDKQVAQAWLHPETIKVVND